MEQEYEYTPPVLTRELLAKMIDHTNLKPYEASKKLRNLCKEALMYDLGAVCINPIHVPLCKEELAGSKVHICSVVGFPLGASRTDIKALEAEKAIEDGATEIDMVMNVGALREKRYDFVKEDIAAVVKATGPILLKVIQETCYLTDEEIVTACKICVEAGADFVKTSTGFGLFGAFPDHLRLMRQTVGPDIGVKASGGISNFKDAYRAIKAGADRLGVSASIPIIEGFNLFKFAGEAWLEEEIPCHFCPSRHANLGKLPKSLYLYYVNKCKDCPAKGYNVFYD